MRRDVKTIQAAILMLAIGCGGTSSPTPTPTPTPITGGPGPKTIPGGDPSPQTVPGPGADGWQAYSPPEGDYTVSLPPGVAPPKQKKEETPTESGPIISRTALIKFPDETGANFNVTHYPKVLLKDSTPQEWLTKAGEAPEKRWGGAPISKKSVRLDGHPAVFMEFHPTPGPSGPAGVRYLQCFANDSLYQVIVVGPRAKVSGEQVTRLLDSFKLVTGQPIPKSPDEASPKGSPAGDTLSAVALSQEFKEDFKAAGKRRLGKMVTVEGVVGELLPAKPGGGPTLILPGYQAPGEPPGKRRIRCTFSAKSTDLPQVQNLMRGEKVTIRGQLSAGGPNFVTLQQSTLVTGSAGSDR